MVAVNTETFESAYDTARTQLGPRLRHAQETVTPVVADVMALARERGSGMLRAARGIEAGAPAPRRWPVGLAGFFGGVAFGAVAVVAVHRIFAPLPLDAVPGGPDQAREQEIEYVRTLPDVQQDHRAEMPVGR